MASMEFKTLEDLYNRIKPALYSKVQELKRNEINFIKEEDIWDYLSNNSWSKSDSLSLAEMVEDIFDLKIDDIKPYVIDIMNKKGVNKKQDNLYKDSEEGTLL